MKMLFVDMKPADQIWKEQYHDETLMSVKIGEEDSGRLHYASVLLSLENAERVLTLKTPIGKQQ